MQVSVILDLPSATRVVLGRGLIATLGAETAQWGYRVLLVCGRTAMHRHGVLAAARTNLEQAGLRVVVFDEVSPDPQTAEVDAAVAVAHRESCDVIVGLGGGSAIDAAKAVAIGLRRGPVGPLVGTTVPDDPDAVPVIAAPTIAGSGAEVTKSAILTDTERHLKSGIRGVNLLPRTAVVDPDLLDTVPSADAAVSAFDAVTHAVEGYVARQADDVTRALNERALLLLGRRLPDLSRGAVDPQIQDDVALAALLGGASVARASTCLPHRLQQAMGSITHVHISHGRGLAAIYPAWLQRVESHAPQRFASLADLLAAPDITEAIGRLRTAAGLDLGLSSYGFVADDISTMVTAINGNVDNDPLPRIDTSVVRGIYHDSL